MGENLDYFYYTQNDLSIDDNRRLSIYVSKTMACYLYPQRLTCFATAVE